MQVGGGAGWGECWFDLLCIYPSGIVTPGPKDKNDGNHGNYNNEGSQSRFSGLVTPSPHIAKNTKIAKMTFSEGSAQMVASGRCSEHCTLSGVRQRHSMSQKLHPLRLIEVLGWFRLVWGGSR